MIYLYISLFFGLLSLAVGFVIAKSVLTQDPGSQKMQEVSGAIKEGALAYLRRQVQTMLPFVVVLAIGLFLLYYKTWGTALAVYLAICFVGGVAASYIAGYTGMLMAVNGNCRTAAAALTSYKKALETAFRSGSVAGLITVGMGLIGATIIFLAAKGDAMKLLVGFGFGGSLAALFMRVGGGIFTKAADVGA
ncbi:MAG TPA: sodium-translocating pyrophosphatase, partial [Armatimonadetes bacterium]|nr:sodium-translocating pyrophosphatase [Armatimonadota bacterium]